MVVTSLLIGKLSFEAYLRGIETGSQRALSSSLLLFEAYLRGIETLSFEFVFRVSAGLKPT